jgi:hypothetical protein
MEGDCAAACAFDDVPMLILRASSRFEVRPQRLVCGGTHARVTVDLVRRVFAVYDATRNYLQRRARQLDPLVEMRIPMAARLQEPVIARVASDTAQPTILAADERSSLAPVYRVSSDVVNGESNKDRTE